MNFSSFLNKIFTKNIYVPGKISHIFCLTWDTLISRGNFDENVCICRTEIGYQKARSKYLPKLLPTSGDFSHWKFIGSSLLVIFLIPDGI